MCDTALVLEFCNGGSSLLQVPVQLWRGNSETHAGTQVSRRQSVVVLPNPECVTAADAHVVFVCLFVLISLLRQTESCSAGQHLPDQTQVAERGRSVRSVWEMKRQPDKKMK